jgi:hypothetical protein
VGERVVEMESNFKHSLERIRIISEEEAHLS